MRVVLDTAVMVAAFRSDRGASRQLLISVLDGGLQLLASVPLMIEYEAVLTRPEHLTAIDLTAAQVNAVLDAVAKLATPILLRFLWRPCLRDPADEMVLETAVNGNADCLVTFNTRDFAEGARDFGIRVLRPVEAWKQVQKHAKK